MATYTNSNLTMLTNGRVEYPIIAVGSYCVLQFSQCTAATKRTITVGTNSVTVTVGSDGTVNLSLMPFIRSDIQSRNVQGKPFTTSWRGELSVAVSNADANTTDKTLTIYYIFGYFHPAKDLDADVWVTYNSAVGDYNVLAVDNASHYNGSGVPTSLANFRAIDVDPSQWVTPPSEGSVETISVQQVASSQMFSNQRNYHFTLDCRTENIINVRWIDENGYPNTRKFTCNEEARGAAVADTYLKPHINHTFVSGVIPYDYGRDEWGTIEGSRTLTVGDDVIPQNQWNWIKGLITSQCVEILEDGAWRRVNVSGGAMTRDPRRATFNFSVKLVTFTDDIQIF